MTVLSAESPTVKLLLPVGDSSLEDLVREYLDAPTEDPNGRHVVVRDGDLKGLLDEAQDDMQPRVIQVVDSERSLQNVILEPIRVSDAIIGIAVTTPPAQPNERWQILYTEVAKAHQATIDFRQKLLAALPVLSGAGIGLLLANTVGPNGLKPWMLVFLGLFGFLVSYGLFMYEARNIQECKCLIERGAALEALAGAPTGQFMFRPPSLALRKAMGLKTRKSGKISIQNASRVVYATVMLAWLSLSVGGLVAWIW
jgi:hypothetical protein